jgi:hypothetical protein
MSTQNVPKIKIKAIVRSPVKPDVDKITEFRRNHAAKVLQNFYKSYIKVDRDKATGLPLDPITAESFEQIYMIRIIYETYNTTSKSIVRRVQCYNIITLWESFKYTKNHVAINPIVNTRFSKAHFKKILKKAVEVKLIDAASIPKYLTQFGYDPGNNYIPDINSSSKYEMSIIQGKSKFKEIYFARLGSLLCYYALKDDFEKMEKLVFISLEYESDPPDPNKSLINYVKKVGMPYPKFPQELSTILKKRIKKNGMNPVYDNTFVFDPEVENRLAEWKIDKYTPLNACAFNQNIQSMTFIMQFSPYLFHPSLTKLDASALQLVLLNPVVNIEMVEILKSYYTEKDLEVVSCVGSIIELASMKIESQPEIMMKLFP